MDEIKKCTLLSQSKNYLDVIIPNNQDVTLGRGPETRIKTPKCSKNQIALRANYEEGTIKFTQLGPNPSKINGKKMRQDETCNLKDGDIINFIPSENILYTLKVETDSESNASKEKRKYEELSEIIDQNKLQDNPINKKRKYDPENEIKLAPIFRKQSKTTTSSKSPSKVSTHSNDSSSTESPKVKYGDGIWHPYDQNRLLVYNVTGVPSSSKIAGFDLDFTIICTKSGKVFPTNLSDWKLLYPSIPQKLAELYQDGYKIVFFTNQRSISKGRFTPQDFFTKVKNILALFTIPIQVFVSTGLGIYRKPRPGMWQILVQEHNNDVPIDTEASFYVGDAAGRPQNWDGKKKKKDFSCSDRLFALNIGIKFYTPEEFFLSQKEAPFTMPEFDPRFLGNNEFAQRIAPDSKILDLKELIGSQQEVIVFVGYPAAGKSFFAKKYLVPRSYVHINRDKLGTWKKCVDMCEQVLTSKKSAVIDNTNPDVESRQRYIEVAKRFNVPCRCFLFNCTIAQAKHQNVFREVCRDKGSADHVPVTDMVLHAYKKNFAPPTLSEGFKEIIRINFVPSFLNKEDERLFRMFLLEH